MLWIYNYTNKAKSQIDHLLMSKKCFNSVLNCEVYLSFEGVSSDDQIVTAKIRLSHSNWATEQLEQAQPYTMTGPC